ncbi:zinc-binding dehydrogenase [Nocardia mangyaensis]|uniref:zinc-binding dehydrogenase n=1 Tax=Nocardia mangyaensis TaxID=2213200 RepID=UPI0026769E9F|nr:zinc-binding dehydrogenase [Nocardia mangyaensis]MDO3646442.1 zinc-binding dehydrogenase [Nocardia mangyaensis]
MLALGQLARPFVKPSIRVPLAEQSPASLTELRELIESDDVRPAIDRTYPLAETPAAIDYMESEHARAKIVITVAA